MTILADHLITVHAYRMLIQATPQSQKYLFMTTAKYGLLIELHGLPKAAYQVLESIPGCIRVFVQVDAQQVLRDLREGETML